MKNCIPMIYTRRLRNWLTTMTTKAISGQVTSPVTLSNFYVMTFNIYIVVWLGYNYSIISADSIFYLLGHIWYLLVTIDYRRWPPTTVDCHRKKIPTSFVNKTFTIRAGFRQSAKLSRFWALLDSLSKTFSSCSLPWVVKVLASYPLMFLVLRIFGL